MQLRGPYSYWQHTHSFEPEGGGTAIRDVVEYALPLGFLGRIAHACLVKNEVNAIFDYRAKRVSDLLGAGVRP